MERIITAIQNLKPNTVQVMEMKIIYWKIRERNSLPHSGCSEDAVSKTV
jgi:hypothetical protein